MLSIKIFYTKGVAYQWYMIHVGMFVVHSTDPETRKNSFGAFNLVPRTRAPFPEWWNKIDNFLQAGNTFKTEEPIDLYELLSATWHHIPCQ